MCNVNPSALAIIALATVVGALLGSWLIGLFAGLLFVVIATVAQLAVPRR